MIYSILKSFSYHKIYTAIFCLLVSHFVQAECKFDPELNRLELIRIAKLQPNAEIYDAASVINWESGELATEVQYIGCETLKFKVSKTIEVDGKLDEKELFNLANRMADKFWLKEDANQLAVKLSARSFNLEDINGDKRLYQYVMNNPNYAEMLLTYDVVDNQVTIEWLKQ